MNPFAQQLLSEMSPEARLVLEGLLTQTPANHPKNTVNELGRLGLVYKPHRGKERLTIEAWRMFGDNIAALKASECDSKK